MHSPFQDQIKFVFRSFPDGMDRGCLGNKSRIFSSRIDVTECSTSVAPTVVMSVLHSVTILSSPLQALSPFYKGAQSILLTCPRSLKETGRAGTRPQNLKSQSTALLAEPSLVFKTSKRMLHLRKNTFWLKQSKFDMESSEGRDQAPYDALQKGHSQKPFLMVMPHSHEANHV